MDKPAENAPKPPVAVKKTPPAFFIIPTVIVVLFLIMGYEHFFGSQRIEGYVEGEFTYVGSAVAGRLQALSVERGHAVTEGQPLFALDQTPQQSAYDEAAAKLQQAQSALDFATKEFARQETLLGQKIATQENYDNVQTAKDQAEKNVGQLKASLINAKWELDQTSQRAPAAGLVFDTLYLPGEWVPAGSPIVVLLTPHGVRVRTYVDETRLGQLHYGDMARVFLDGAKEPTKGKIVYISPAAEYTPPVIYSQESRSKFVWRVDIGFDDATALKLHPGQPVEVDLRDRSGQ